MKMRVVFAATSLTLLIAGMDVISGDAVGRQVSAVDHRYLFRAAITVDGIENLQK